MTKQQAVEAVKAKIQSLRDEAKHPTVIRLGLSTSCSVTADKLQWALDLLTDCEDWRRLSNVD